MTTKTDVADFEKCGHADEGHEENLIGRSYGPSGKDPRLLSQCKNCWSILLKRSRHDELDTIAGVKRKELIAYMLDCDGLPSNTTTCTHPESAEKVFVSEQYVFDNETYWMHQCQQCYYFVLLKKSGIEKFRTINQEPDKVIMGYIEDSKKFPSH